MKYPIKYPENKVEVREIKDFVLSKLTHYFPQFKFNCEIMSPDMWPFYLMIFRWEGDILEMKFDVIPKRPFRSVINGPSTEPIKTQSAFRVSLSNYSSTPKMSIYFQTRTVHNLDKVIEQLNDFIKEKLCVLHGDLSKF